MSKRTFNSTNAPGYNVGRFGSNDISDLKATEVGYGSTNNIMGTKKRIGVLIPVYTQCLCIHEVVFTMCGIQW